MLAFIKPTDVVRVKNIQLRNDSLRKLLLRFESGSTRLYFHTASHQTNTMRTPPPLVGTTSKKGTVLTSDPTTLVNLPSKCASQMSSGLKQCCADKHAFVASQKLERRKAHSFKKFFVSVAT